LPRPINWPIAQVKSTSAPSENCVRRWFIRSALEPAAPAFSRNSASAKFNKLKIVGEFYDEAVSGADPVHEREGFAELLDHIGGNGARTILCESAGRFARDLIIQITGHKMLNDLGYELVPVDAPLHFTDDTPTTQMVRSILGAVSEFEKAQLVSKLKVARKRKRKANGKCEDRKSYQKLNPPLVRETKRLRRKNPVSGKQKSYIRVAKELFQTGYSTGTGKVFSCSQIQNLVS
jgi:DNA invertase Pin-like site-specific DNA recombinase